LESRAEEDLAALENYKQNHEPSTIPHGGYPEWEGSDAQRLFQEDLDEGKHTFKAYNKPKKLWKTQAAYQI
jgi:hypothetical protein